MPPKKKAAKKAAAGDDEGIDPGMMKTALTAAVDGLKMKLVLEQERKDKSGSMIRDIYENE